MKKTNKRIVSSVASIALCASLVAGGTYALFTSEQTVNIAVTSGTVKVVASVNEESLTTYSMGELQEAGKFENGGTAGFNDESQLELSLMTPGDKAEFTVDIANESNVAIQYRVSFGVSGGLADALDCTATNANNTWVYAEAKAEISSVAVTVELPESVDDKYQTITDTVVTVKVEAVQGNADVTTSKASTEATLLKALNDPAITNITLNESFDLTEMLTIPADKELALDLNSHTANNSLMNYGDVTISNGEIEIAAAGFENFGNATITNVTMNAGSAADYSNICHAGSETVYDDVTVNSAGGGVGAVDGGKVTFNSGSVEVDSTSTSGRYLFYAVGEGTEITINGGSFDFNKTQNQKRAYIYAGVGATVYVTGGTFGKASTRSGYTAGILGDGTVIITGGTFGFNPFAWVAEGYQAVESNGVWTVIQE